MRVVRIVLTVVSLILASVWILSSAIASSTPSPETVDQRPLMTAIDHRVMEESRAEQLRATARWMEAEAENERKRQAAIAADRERRRIEAEAHRQRQRADRSSGVGRTPVDPGSNRALGQSMAAERGWVGVQWDCLDDLWGPLESRWNHTADNPHSSAYGIPQALPGSKMGPGWQHDPAVQIRWGLGYIAGKYGTPCNAKAVRIRKGWY